MERNETKRNVYELYGNAHTSKELGVMHSTTRIEERTSGTTEQNGAEWNGAERFETGHKPAIRLHPTIDKKNQEYVQSDSLL